MKILETSIDGLFEIHYGQIIDSRGQFARLYCTNEFKDAGIDINIVQINQSINSKKGTVRGMHFQHRPKGEYKVIRCVRGRVQDVIVDLRPKSTSFLKHQCFELHANSWTAVIVPPGCAHGFQTLEDDSHLIYFHSQVFEKGFDSGVNFQDPSLQICWPLPVTEISEKDRNFPFITANTKFY